MPTTEKILKIFTYLLLLEILATFLVMAFDKGLPIYKDFFGALIVSLPLILNYFLLLPFVPAKKNIMFITFWSIASAYIVNLAVSSYVINMFAQSVIIDGGMGEGGGYWLLFTIGGAFKFSLAGMVIGALFSTTYLLIGHTVNHRDN